MEQVQLFHIEKHHLLDCDYNNENLATFNLTYSINFSLFIILIQILFLYLYNTCSNIISISS